MMSIAVYLRVSTDDQARNGYGLGDQETQCMKYIDLYYSKEDKVTFYRDDGYSAKNLHRPKMEEMLSDLDKGNINVIIAYKLDRLTRSVMDTYELIKRVTDKNCTLIAIVDRLDITSANGRMLVGMLSVIAQWEREVISERTIAGLTEMAREGKYPLSGVPFGWTKSKDKYLSINKGEKLIITDIISHFIKGYAFTSIHEYIKSQYNLNIRDNEIRKLIKREINVGIWHYRGCEYNDIFPPLITQEEYKEVQRLLKHRQKKIGEKKTYCLHSLVFCSICGDRLDHLCTVKKTKTYYYYYCRRCNHRINQEWLKKEVFFKVAAHLRENEISKKEEQIHKKIEKHMKHKEDLFNHFNNDQLTIEQYVYTLKKIDEQIHELEKEISRLNTKTLKELNALPELDIFDFFHTYIERVYLDIEHKSVIKIIYR